MTFEKRSRFAPTTPPLGDTGEFYLRRAVVSINEDGGRLRVHSDRASSLLLRSNERDVRLENAQRISRNISAGGTPDEASRIRCRGIDGRGRAGCVKRHADKHAVEILTAEDSGRQCTPGGFLLPRRWNPDQAHSRRVKSEGDLAHAWRIGRERVSHPTTPGHFRRGSPSGARERSIRVRGRDRHRGENVRIW
jgi:hypothetical protein